MDDAPGWCLVYALSPRSPQPELQGLSIEEESGEVMSSQILIHHKVPMEVHVTAPFNPHEEARIEALRTMLEDISRRRIQITYFEELKDQFVYKGIIGENFDRRRQR